MKTPDFAGIVPAQYTGKEIEAEAAVELRNESEAKLFYEVARDRLLHVNKWHEVAGIISAVFQLVGADGKEVTRSPQEGDFFKIDIPGPGSSAGDGYDWVCVEALKEVSNDHMQCIGLRVRPSQNPCDNDGEIAHFYSKEATSSFYVAREYHKVSAVIIDRNIKPNDYTDTLMDKIRDTAVGLSAIGMFSKIQWQKLAAGLVEKEEMNK
ncbi:MAG: hypothetical protein V4722_07285 [Bacteroidota bacterium]